MRYERKEETRDTLRAWISTVRLGGASEEAGPAASLAIGFPVRTGYRLVSIKLLARITFFFLPLAEVKKFRFDKKKIDVGYATAWSWMEEGLRGNCVLRKRGHCSGYIGLQEFRRVYFASFSVHRTLGIQVFVSFLLLSLIE